MKIFKKILILLIILLMVLLIILLIKKDIIIQENKEKINYNGQFEKEEYYTEVTNPVMYFTVKECLDKYVNYLSEYNNDILYNLLEDSYKNENGITMENLSNYIQKIDENSVAKIQRMYVEEKDNIQTYFIYAKLVIDDNLNGDITKSESSKDFYITIILDINNKTYAVIPNDGGVFNETK